MMYQECYTEKILQQISMKHRIVEAASGREKADLVLKNASYVNVFTGQISHGDIAVADGVIVGIGEYAGREEMDVSGKVLMPGFIDAHIHLESALVSPKEFAKAVLPHGTTTIVTDPHEIANIMGTDGIEYMLQATRGLPLDVQFMLPSCVPATPLDESGADLNYRSLEQFYSNPRVRGLAEMMDYVGVVNAAPVVLDKIESALVRGKKVDGHAPGLADNELNAYIAAGISSDHECSSFEEAVTKIERGQYIMIREGTAAKNLKSLLPLLTSQYADRCMFCCDDKHPNDLLTIGHIDYHIKQAIRSGVAPVLAVKAACCTAAQYLHMSDRGAIAPGYIADIVIVDNMCDFNIDKVFKYGRLVAEKGHAVAITTPNVAKKLIEKAHNTFHISHLTGAAFQDSQPHGLIGLVTGEIVSQNQGCADHIDLEKDILKIAVIERHKNTGHIGIGYLHGYGLKSGAVATSVSHDSHNIIVVGTDEDAMALAVNQIIDSRGGIVVVGSSGISGKVVLEIAGIMSDDTLENVAKSLEQAKAAAYQQGVNPGIDPFMTLSFMALPVIPELRITTKGVFDVNRQQFV